MYPDDPYATPYDTGYNDQQGDWSGMVAPPGATYQISVLDPTLLTQLWEGEGGKYRFDPSNQQWILVEPAATPPVVDEDDTDGEGDGSGDGTTTTTTTAPEPQGPLAPFTGTFAPPTAPGAPEGISVDLGGPSGIDYIPPTPEFQTPEYTKPPAFSFDEFRAPTIEEALNSPGYKFRTGQGVDALQRWAAARGTLNDSGTAKALIDYGQNAASQEYQNVWDRNAQQYLMNRSNALTNYNTNYGTQFVDPYQFSFQNAAADLAPQLQGYSTQAGAGQLQNQLNYGNAWDRFLQDYRQDQEQKNRVLDTWQWWGTA